MKKNANRIAIGFNPSSEISILCFMFVVTYKALSGELLIIIAIAFTFLLHRYFLACHEVQVKPLLLRPNVLDVLLRNLKLFLQVPKP